MSVRTTGGAMLNAQDQQETMDMATVAHVSAIESVRPISYTTIKNLVPWEDINRFRQRGLNPQHPIMRGMGQDPQTYYQAAVSANGFYDAIPGIVQATMDELGVLTGRHYNIFDFYGDRQAERVIVMMGSSAKTAEECVDYLNKKGEKVGLVKVRLFRPFSVEHFLKALPETTKSIAVLDRTKEDLAASLPLHADVLTALSEAGVYKTVVGGNYGLGGKEFTPRHVKAVFDNLLKDVPKNHYTIGINDDVTNTNLEVGPIINTTPKGTTQAMFFGLGSDGTVGANKAATSIVIDKTELYAQGHFNYSSQKAGASTVSHLRFGPKPIRGQYEIEDKADYVACHHTSFLPKFDLLAKSRKKSVYVVTCPWSTVEELDKEFPAKLRRSIAAKQVALYTVDAHAVAVSVGLDAKRLNQVMQAIFFHLAEFMPKDNARMELENAIDTVYKNKPPQVRSANKVALAAAVNNLNLIDYPESWMTVEDNEISKRTLNPSHTPYSAEIDEFTGTFLKGIDNRTADNLPVSAFSAGGETPIGQSTFQKRALAEEVPVWIPDKCTQCNLCSVVCPHAVVRPFLLDKSEVAVSPKGYQSRKAKGGELGGLYYTIQLAPYDCTGCAVCVEMCPDDALVMQSQKFSQESFNEHWEYSLNKVTIKDHLMDKNTVKGSQFQQPLLEFSGACSGCGETPYVKLLTQMFGDRMVIANSSGCSSVWGGSFGLSPFKKNKDGQGPAWARSLFEDTAEYGLGMALGSEQRRQKLIADVRALVTHAADEEEDVFADLTVALEKWLGSVDDPDKCNALQPEIRRLLAAAAPLADDDTDLPEILETVAQGSDMLVAPSHWIIGGDGWAYDIGFGGVDHVLASGQNINILVLDTEVYSNTGAQASKASPKGASIKMCVGGKEAKKKDLGAIAMMHENAYVASVSMAADPSQTAKAFKEAEAYNGPSLIVSYATCVDWGHRLGDKAMALQQIQAVDSGYWPLYRYHPDKANKAGEQPFELDMKRIDGKAMEQFIMNENRFTSLQRVSPEHAKMLQGAMVDEAGFRHENRRRMSMSDEDLLDYLKKVMGEQPTGERVN